MNEPLPTVRLKNAWHSTHRGSSSAWSRSRPQRPARQHRRGRRGGRHLDRPRLLHGHSRIALRMLETDPDVPADAGLVRAQDRRGRCACGATSSSWTRPRTPGGGSTAKATASAASSSIATTTCWWSVLQRRRVAAPRMDLQRAARAVPRLPLHSFADEHVQKQESFDYATRSGTQPAIVSEHGIRFPAPIRPARTRPASSPTSARTANGCRGVRRAACSTCAATPAVSGCMPPCGRERGGRHRHRPAVIEIAKENAHLNRVKPRFVQADIFPWLRDAANNGEQFDVVIPIRRR